MSENPGPERTTPLSDSEHARIVAEVLEDQARRQAAREASADPTEETDTSFFVQVGLLVTGTFFFYLLFFSPAWIAPATPEPIAAAHVEEGLRFHMSVVARHVEAFRDDAGHLPSSLEELEGVAREGVEYRRLDADTFEIRARAGDASLRYVSTQPLEEFYGGVGSRILEGTS